MMTWEEITAIEPRLLELEQRVLGGAYFDAQETWVENMAWNAIKTELSSLVGWDSEDLRLIDSSLYDVCYQKLRAVFRISCEVHQSEWEETT